MEIALEQFVDNLVSSGLMTAAEVAAFQESLAQGPKPADAAGLARILVQRRLLTRYQAAAIYQGKTRGLVLGEYTILEKIGAGGMGQVYKAKHRTMDRLVALKILPSTLVESPDAIKRFRREVRAAARLMHPNVVTALDAGEQDGIFYLVMEYVDGIDLARLVQERGPLSVREAIDYAIQAARGLVYAHEQGIIHRDIKPGNLLLDKKGTIKILDLGLARIDQIAGPSDSTVSLRVSSRGRLMGTCDYMAPEQADNVHYVDNRADIYALGCTLYRLLSGQPPFRGTAAQVLLAHREAAIPSLRELRADVPPELEAAVRKMMAKQPANRYRSMAEVVADLEACLAATVSPEGNVEAPLSPSDQAVRSPVPGAAGTTAVPVALPLDEEVIPVAEPLIEDIDLEAGGRPVRRPQRRGWWLLGVAATGLLALGLAALAFRILPRQRGANIANGSPFAESLADSPVLAADSAGRYQRYWADRFGLSVERTNSLGMPLVFVPQGDFAMGSSREEIHQLVQSAQEAGAAREEIDRLSSEGPQHAVFMTKPYYLGRREVTVAEFARFVEDTGYRTDAERERQGDPREERPPRANVAAAKGTWRNPGFAQSPGDPVVEVSWNDAAAFCRWLGEKEGHRYRLPTEAEWEYACRAGTATRYSFGDGENDLEAYGWFAANAGRSPHPAGQKKPNGWGLYDMHGNVEEWCQDWYDPVAYEKAPPLDLGGPEAGSRRVIRGGGWNDAAAACRSACRRSDEPANHSPARGFRVVLAR